MNTVLMIILAVDMCVVSFSAGVLWQMNRDDKRMSARVIRPANITVNRNYYITEYAVQNEDALKINYPNTELG